MSQEYYDGESSYDMHYLSGRERKQLDGKHKFFICDEAGNCVKIAWNKTPSAAGRKGASMGLPIILVVREGDGKEFWYEGGREPIPRHMLTAYQAQRGMAYRPFVHRIHPEELEGEEY